MWEPGLIPAPGGLLDWRDAQHFDRWQMRPCALCDKPTPMRSHYGEPVHKACAEDWIAANPPRPASAGSPPTSSPNAGATRTTPDPSRWRPP